MMNITMVCGRKILHAFSVYSPQQLRPSEEKREFFENYQIIYMMSLKRIF